MAKVVALAPDSWMPGGEPDPLIRRQHGHIGRPISRIDGPLKVAGQARFAAEFTFDGMVYAALAFSTIARGRIAEIDDRRRGGRARRRRGDDPPQRAPAPADAGLHVRAQGRRRRRPADHAGRPRPLERPADRRRRSRKRRSRPTTPRPCCRSATRRRRPPSTSTPPRPASGAPACSWARRSTRSTATPRRRWPPPTPAVDSRYTTPRHNHNAIELHAVTVAWNGDELRVHDASQLVAHTAWSLAKIFGIAEEQVVVTSPFVGGGFGGKCLWQHQVLAAAAARVAGRPVRLTLSREGVYRVVGGRTLTEQRVALGASRDGRLTALIHTGVTAKTRTTSSRSRSSCRRAAPMLRRPSSSTSRRSSSTCSPTPSCARPARRSAPSPSKARWTSSPPSSASTRSSCASATSRRRTRSPASPSPRATSPRPGAPAPSASAGSGAIPSPPGPGTASG